MSHSASALDQRREREQDAGQRQFHRARSLQKWSLSAALQLHRAVTCTNRLS
jgi:hypothetical protein